jgi:hypothetical protein
MTAAIIALKPTDPTPNTAIDDPAGARKAFNTAPAPVCTPQPREPNISRGISFGTLTVLRWDDDRIYIVVKPI